MEQLNFTETTNEILELLKEKNTAYGDSASNTYKKYGLIAYLIRMEDKINRLRTLTENPSINPNDEKIEDSLRDLAGYAILALTQIRAEKPKQENGLIAHAKRELDLILKECEDDESILMQQSMNEGILNVIRAFSEYGHSGYSAQYAIDLINKLLNYSFITPLTGNDDEWTEVSDGIYQNKRESKIFKQVDRFDGKPYYINGKIFSRDGGESWMTNGDSFITIEFPLYKLPESEYIILEDKE